MRIKNIGKCLIVFNGGSLPVGKVADFKGEAEKIGDALLKAYPDRLLDLDHIKEEEVVSVKVESPVEESATEEPKSEEVKKSKKSKKSKK